LVKPAAISTYFYSKSAGAKEKTETCCAAGNTTGFSFLNLFSEGFASETFGKKIIWVRLLFCKRRKTQLRTGEHNYANNHCSEMKESPVVINRAGRS